MIAPVVLQMILCEDARPRKGARGKFDVFGVVNIIHAPAEVFPIRLSLSVYVCLTDGRGRGYGRITIVDEETEERIFNGDLRTLDFGSDPMILASVTLWVPMCELPKPGVYRVEFVYNESVIGMHSLLVRETP
jgi:hypothetical protein